MLDDRLEVLRTLPPTVTKVLLPAPGDPLPAEAADVADIVLTRVGTAAELDKLKLESESDPARTAEAALTRCLDASRRG